MSLPTTQRPPTLYSLTEEYRRALEELEYCDPSEPEDADRVQAVLGMLKDELAIKAPAVAARALELENFADMVSEAAMRMVQRAGRLKKRAASLKAYLLANMLALPERQRKLANDELEVSVCKNPSPVEIAPGTDLPDEYLRDPPKIEVPALQVRALNRLARAAWEYDSTPIDADFSKVSEELQSAIANVRVIGPLPVIERMPDKKAIADALKAGKEIPGCKLVPSYRLKIE